MKGTLHIVSGIEEKKSISLEIGRYTIGREADAHIQIASHQISRKHAEIIVDEHSVTLLDCGSANGTAVNGKFVTTSALRHGDQIMIGEVVLEYRSAQPAQHVMTKSVQPPRVRQSSFYSSATKLINDRFRPRALWPLFTLLFAIAFLGVALGSGYAYRILLTDRLEQEAVHRAHGLVRYLAEKNREDLKLKNGLLLDVDSILREPGVREAIIISAKKRVLAPISRLDQMVNDPFTAEALSQNSDRRIEPSPLAPDGTQVFVHPIRTYNDQSGKYQILGVAKIVFSPKDAIGTLEEADHLLYLMLGAVGLLSLLFGWISAKALTSPLGRLAEKIHRWRAGQIFEKESAPYRDLEPLYNAVDQALEESQR